MFGVDLHARGKLRFERLGLTQTVFQTVFEDIAERDDLDVIGAHQNVLNGLCASAAATDEPGSQLLVARAAHQFRLDDLKRGGAGDGGRQKRSAGYRTAFHKVTSNSEP